MSNELKSKKERGVALSLCSTVDEYYALWSIGPIFNNNLRRKTSLLLPKV